MRIPVGVFLGIPVGRFPGLACADRAGPGKVHSQFFDYLPLNKFSKIKEDFEQKKKWRNEAVYIALGINDGGITIAFARIKDNFIF